MDISLLEWSGARVAAQPGPVPWACTLHRPATSVLVSRTPAREHRTPVCTTQTPDCGQGLPSKHVGSLGWGPDPSEYGPGRYKVPG
jgi:hypothetical protein